MIRALFFGVLALLFAAASAVPTVEQEQDIIGDVINALGIGFVSGINITITVSVINMKIHNYYSLTTELQQLESLETNLIRHVRLFVIDLAAHRGECLLSVDVASKLCLTNTISFLEMKNQSRTLFLSNWL